MIKQVNTITCKDKDSRVTMQFEGTNIFLHGICAGGRGFKPSPYRTHLRSSTMSPGFIFG
jgi:hypothetical protein